MKTTTIAIAAAMLATSIPAHGHFIWLTINRDGKTAILELADSPGKEIAPILFQLKSRFELSGLSKLKDSSDHRQMTATIDSHHNLIGVEALYGVFQSALVHWSAKALSNTDHAMVPTGLKGEILLRRSHQGWSALVTLSGHPVAGIPVEVYPSGQEAIFAKTGKDGTIALPKIGGLVQIGAMIFEPEKGRYNGQPYTQKVEACSLTAIL